MIELKSREPRSLPIFILADTSGSMFGEKISALNLALRDMVTALNEEKDVRGKFQLCIITFGGTVQNILPLSDIDQVSLTELTASGNTPMGEAFTMVKKLIENKDIVSSRAYSPTIVLLSDGLPTDCPYDMVSRKTYLDWQSLNELHSSERLKKCLRLALGIGQDADQDMLKAFINNPEIPVITAKDTSGIVKFFKWVTMSTISRMSSVNPNLPLVVPPSVVFDPNNEDIDI